MATGIAPETKSQLVILFHPQSERLLVYEATSRSLRLVAARKCTYDREIVDFINVMTSGSGPHVQEIKKSLENARKGKIAPDALLDDDRGADAPSPPAPKMPK